MTRTTIIWTVFGWLILMLINHYLLPWFIVPFFWLGLLLGLFVTGIIQLIKLFNERKSLSKFRIVKVIVFCTLFFLTVKSSIIDEIIEKVDWIIFYKRRMEIIDEVQENKLTPNENGVCKLPFEFPILSHGGNDILVDKDSGNTNMTVTFFIYRNYFDATSIELVYTNNLEKTKELENRSANSPRGNWKIKNNWYRVEDR